MTVNVTTVALSVYPWKKRRMTDAFRCCFCGEYSPICLFRSGLSTLFFIFLFFSGPLLNLFTFCFAGSLHRHWKDGSCSDKSKVKRRGRAVMRVTEENSLSIIPTGMSILNNTTFFFFWPTPSFHYFVVAQAETFLWNSYWYWNEGLQWSRDIDTVCLSKAQICTQYYQFYWQKNISWIVLKSCWFVKCARIFTKSFFNKTSGNKNLQQRQVCVSNSSLALGT